MQQLEFSVDIAAPVARVWDLMLTPDSYREWTSAFCEGSYYEGSWAQGGTIRFLSPGGAGMVAEVVENKLHEAISIRHIGELRDGKLVPDSALATQPAHEDYRYSPTAGGGTHLVVSMEGIDGFLDFLQACWPKALARLKALAEQAR